MKRLNKYYLKKISNNLDYFFNLATKTDITNGKIWYPNSNDFCKEVANKYNCTPFLVANVVSALSPRNKWEQNLKDTITIFEAVKNNIAPENIKVCTFHSNKFKAYNSAKNNILIDASANKTFAFCENVGNLNSNYITVDIWHLRACFGKKIAIGSAQIGNVAYQQISRLTQSKAKQVGLKGYEYQAIVWLSVKENYLT